MLKEYSENKNETYLDIYVNTLYVQHNAKQQCQYILHLMHKLITIKE